MLSLNSVSFCSLEAPFDDISILNEFQTIYVGTLQQIILFDIQQIVEHLIDRIDYKMLSNLLNSVLLIINYACVA